MDDLLSLANDLVENNNYKNDNNFEEKKHDGDYEAKVLSGDYINENFYISLFLTEKTIKTTLSKLMRLIDAAGYTIDVSMFSDTGTIIEGMQSVVGSTVELHKTTSKKGYINYSFGGEE